MNACENQIQELLFTSTVQCLHQVIDSVYAIDIAIALEQFDKGSLLAFLILLGLASLCLPYIL
ncbi:MAG: hypothetical protein R3Y24_13820 [Eubacteriales bacterium]